MGEPVALEIADDEPAVPAAAEPVSETPASAQTDTGAGIVPASADLTGLSEAPVQADDVTGQAPAVSEAPQDIQETQTDNPVQEITDPAEQAGGETAETAPVVDIEEEGPALAAEAPDTVNDTPVALAGINIGDAGTPLAPGTDIPAPTGWWALLALILGTAGTEMYRRHYIKKRGLSADKDNK